MKYLPFAVLLIALPAQAHVVASPNTAPADSYAQVSMRVGHGCDDKFATTEIHVNIPDGIATVHAQYKPGWKVKRVTDGETIADMPGMKMPEAKVIEIIWSGGTLPADQYDDFGLLMKMPDTEGKTLWFPVTQICGKAKKEWAEIPAEGQAWHNMKMPAPFVRVISKSE
jgi:uncharacterized protein YcnI